MTAFWDSSALFPLCIPGQATTRERQLLRDRRPVVWWGTALEVFSALARFGRQGHLSSSRQRVAVERLARLRLIWREVQPTESLCELAEQQLHMYELRAADALQLAAALVWCGQRPKQRGFLCRDLRLKDAARQAGFQVVEL
jgi:predicted nucleic acid-binding protein